MNEKNLPLTHVLYHFQGVLDLVVTEEREPAAGSPDQLLAFRHHLQDDHAFLKVLGEHSVASWLVTLFNAHPSLPVLSGHCYHNCRSGQMVDFCSLSTLKHFSLPLSFLSLPPALWLSTAWSCCEVLNYRQNGTTERGCAYFDLWPRPPTPIRSLWSRSDSESGGETGGECLSRRPKNKPCPEILSCAGGCGGRGCGSLSSVDWTGAQFSGHCHPQSSLPATQVLGSFIVTPEDRVV